MMSESTVVNAVQGRTAYDRFLDEAKSLACVSCNGAGCSTCRWNGFLHGQKRIIGLDAEQLAEKRLKAVEKKRKHDRFKSYSYGSKMLNTLKMQLDVMELRAPSDFEDACDIMIASMQNNGTTPGWAFERLNDLYNKWCAKL